MKGVGSFVVFLCAAVTSYHTQVRINLYIICICLDLYSSLLLNRSRYFVLSIQYVSCNHQWNSSTVYLYIYIDIDIYYLYLYLFISSHLSGMSLSHTSQVYITFAVVCLSVVAQIMIYMTNPQLDVVSVLNKHQ